MRQTLEPSLLLIPPANYTSGAASNSTKSQDIHPINRVREGLEKSQKHPFRNICMVLDDEDIVHFPTVELLQRCFFGFDNYDLFGGFLPPLS